jgi:hypothetical protein
MYVEDTNGTFVSYIQIGQRIFVTAQTQDSLQRIFEIKTSRRLEIRRIADKYVSINSTFDHLLSQNEIIILDSTVLALDKKSESIGLAVNSFLAVQNTEQSTSLLSLDGHQDNINSLKFHPTKDLLVSGSDDKTVKIWNTQTGECTTTLQPGDSEITSVCWNPDGSSLLASAWDGKVYVWDFVSLEGVEVEAAVPFSTPQFQSLLEPQWERSVLKGLASRLRPSSLVDAELVIEAVANNQPLLRLPHKTTFEMGSPVELLIDTDETMMPFTDDCYRLEAMMAETTGRDLLRILRFREQPNAGAGEGPVFDWTPWQLPAPGTHIIVVSNFGALPWRPGYTRRQWLAFAKQVEDGNCSLCTLMPIAPRYLSHDLRSAMKVVHWDRGTSLKHIKNLILHR